MKRIFAAVLILAVLLFSCGRKAAPAAAPDAAEEPAALPPETAAGFSVPELPIPSAAASTAAEGTSAQPQWTQTSAASQNTHAAQSDAKPAAVALTTAATTKAAASLHAAKPTTTRYIYTNHTAAATRASTAQSTAARTTAKSTAPRSTASSTTSRTAAIAQSVLLSIDGSAAVPYGYNVYLPEQTMALHEGDSVLDLLKRCGIPVQSSGSGRMAYISRIGGLGEKDCGGSSGWVYEVNGVRPPVSCGAYQPKNGDQIVWSYSLAP